MANRIHMGSWNYGTYSTDHYVGLQYKMADSLVKLAIKNYGIKMKQYLCLKNGYQFSISHPKVNDCNFVHYLILILCFYFKIRGRKTHTKKCISLNFQERNISFVNFIFWKKKKNKSTHNINLKIICLASLVETVLVS